jgi:SAM-dependent methyltransferase
MVCMAIEEWRFKVAENVAHDAPPTFTTADFEIADAAIDAVLSGNVRQAFDIADPVWKEHAAKEISTRRLGVRRWLKRLLRRGRNAREQTEVQSGYETHWTLAPTVEKYIADLNDRVIAVEWRNKGFLVAPQVLRQVHMLYLMRAIEVLKPRRVLEVGCGNGNIVLTLAARFPNIRFSGVELTSNGVAVAKAVQALAELPSSFVDSAPEPLLDVTAHRTAELQVGDASALPFSDNSFDLIYTRLALEQMEQIREKALKEIARVSSHAVVLIEPWKDYNLRSPGRDYIRRMGYFAARIADMKKFGFKVIMSTGEIPQKVQFNAGPVIAIRP